MGRRKLEIEANVQKFLFKTSSLLNKCGVHYKSNVGFQDKFNCTNNLTFQSPKFKTGYRLKTSFETRVSRMGLGSFVDINIFVMNYYII